MEHVSEAEKHESIKSFQSTINKCENALAQMIQKGANTTLIEKRLHALYIGLAVLNYAWYQTTHSFTKEDMMETRRILTGLSPSLESAYAKSKTGSPQRTLLKRRMKSLELAVQAIDDCFGHN